MQVGNIATESVTSMSSIIQDSSTFHSIESNLFSVLRLQDSVPPMQGQNLHKL
jgi:hypothetical protein